MLFLEVSKIILCGDFYQLAPVPNELYGDTSLYCFQSEFCKQAFPHVVELQGLHRQTDKLLINAVNECGKGILSKETKCYIKSLERPLPEYSIHLFARNHDTDIYNYERLENSPGTPTVYDAEDEGAQFYLHKITVQKHLALKVGCPIVLMKNLSPVLVNGLQGTVLQLFPDSVVISFTSNSRRITSTIKKHVFEFYDPVHKIIVAKKKANSIQIGLWIDNSQISGFNIEICDFTL